MADIIPVADRPLNGILHVRTPYLPNPHNTRQLYVFTSPLEYTNQMHVVSTILYCSQTRLYKTTLTIWHTNSCDYDRPDI